MVAKSLTIAVGRIAGLGALFLLSFALWPLPAQASLLFCNRMTVPIEGAVGYREDNQWVSEGWWRVEPNKCARVYGRELKDRFYYYFARSLAGDHILWGGRYEFCVANQPFRIVGDGECVARGYQGGWFNQIELRGVTDFSVMFE